ncbi:hypothetical protein B296_00007697 [Ensete ventricosum]|uniref:Uncharacterized protein n=1 Tax=Ensete ventricosum TaxID=4639 RepID=A0A427B3E3_ENSVE|nr:hypothetical protein B296_00007697 [Ensete ventricosum]
MTKTSRWRIGSHGDRDKEELLQGLDGAGRLFSPVSVSLSLSPSSPSVGPPRASQYLSRVLYLEGDESMPLLRL